MVIESSDTFHFATATELFRSAIFVSDFEAKTSRADWIPEHHLRDALTKQRKHLEDIKKATNYDSTRKLIERYDDSLPPSPITPHGTPFGTPQRGSQGIPPSQPGTPNPVTPKKAGKGSKAAGGPGPGPSTPRAPGHLNGAGGTPLRGSHLFSRIRCIVYWRADASNLA